MALGQAGVALPLNAWAFQNPASAASLHRRVLGLFITRLYGMSELQLGSLHVGFPTPAGWFSLRIRHFGFRQYGDTRAGIGWAGTPAGLPLTLGGYVYLKHVRIAGYDSRTAIGYQVGAQLRLMKTFLFGTEAMNLFAPQTVAEAPMRTRRWSAGIAYQPVDGVWLLLDVEKEPFFPFSMRGGMEVWVLSHLALRGGFTTAPRRMTAGIGLRIGPLSGDFALVVHPYLGWTPALSTELLW